MTMIKRFVTMGLATLFALSLAGGFAAAADRAPARKAAPAAKVDINSAGVEALSTLPGVGAKLAARIVAYRKQQGPFKTTQELMNVRGIGEKNFARLEAYLTVGGGAPHAAQR
jgi:competence protein ComEA